MISYCMTLKNRANLLDNHLDNLKEQTFPTQEIQLCISDGGSSDNVRDVILKHSDAFGRVLFCTSDRSALPFVIPSNNPTCDKNALVASLASDGIVILTDPEVCWTRRESISDLVSQLSTTRHWASIPTYIGNSGHIGLGYIDINSSMHKGVYSGCGFCLCFHKEMFVERRGFEERFVMGYACDDVYFCDSWRRDLSEVVTDERVFHHWHDDKHLLKKNQQLLEHNLVVARELNGSMPNIGNDNWQRPEMIHSIEEIK